MNEDIAVTSENSNKRIRSIDQFRGIAIILMVVGGFIGQVKLMPSILRHTSDPTVWFTLADLVAPMFIFTIGLTFGLSYNKRRNRDGKVATTKHFLLRYFALIGFGATMTAFENIARDLTMRSDWAVFQAIGLSGIILLIFIDLKTEKRLLIGVVLLILYQLLLNFVFYDVIITSNHAGVIGALSWGSMLIFGSCFSDYYFKSKKQYMILLLAFIIAAIITAVVINPSKLTMSLSFVIIATAISAAGFIIVDTISKPYVSAFDPLSWWGKNPVILYFANGVAVEFILGIVLPKIFWFDAPIWLAIGEGLILLCSFTYFAWYLESKRVLIKI